MGSKIYECEKCGTKFEVDEIREAWKYIWILGKEIQFLLCDDCSEELMKYIELYTKKWIEKK